MRPPDPPDPPDPNVDALRDLLVAEARRRFGEERARVLTPELSALAADLVSVTAAPLPNATEPGFFLLEP